MHTITQRSVANELHEKNVLCAEFSVQKIEKAKTKRSKSEIIIKSEKQKQFSLIIERVNSNVTIINNNTMYAYTRFHKL